MNQVINGPWAPRPEVVRVKADPPPIHADNFKAAPAAVARHMRDLEKLISHHQARIEWIHQQRTGRQAHRDRKYERAHHEGVIRDLDMIDRTNRAMRSITASDANLTGRLVLRDDGRVRVMPRLYRSPDERLDWLRETDRECNPTVVGFWRRAKLALFQWCFP